MKIKHTLILIAVTTLLAGTARAADTAPTPEHTVTGNLTLASDYRFRGISQTYKLPTTQGGLDYSHSSGAYLGIWLSNVSGNSYNNGAGLEVDVYGGFKFALSQDLTLDLGALAYVYPGARLNSAPGVATNEKYTNVDVYAAISVGAFSAKLSIAATDYFGLNSTTAGYAYFSSLAGKGSSKGSAYLDLNYSVDLGDGLTLGAHIGHLAVKGYGDLSYTDYKLGLTKTVAGLNLGAAIVGANAKRDFYQATNAAGLNAKRLGTTGLVLSLGKTF